MNSTPRTLKSWLAVLFSIVILVSGVAWLITRGETQPRSVVIAGNLPLTGFLAEYGGAVRDGVSLAADEIAVKHPDWPRLSFDWQDNNTDAKTALTIVQKQLIHPPNVYISGIGPSLVLPVMDKVAQSGIPNFVWTFDVNIRKGDQINNFRTNVSYKIEPALFLKYVQRRGAKRVAILHLLLPHAVEEFRSIVVPDLKKAGVSEILVEPFELGKSDFSDLAIKLRTFRPDALILNGFQMDLVNIIKAFRPLGLINDGNTIGTYDMMDTMTILGAAELEGIRAVVPAYIVAPTSTSKAWTQRFVDHYARPPIYTNAFGYDAATIIADASRRLVLPANPDQWRKAIAETDIPDGVTGPLKMDSGGDLMVPLAVGVFRNGQLVAETIP